MSEATTQNENQAATEPIIRIIVESPDVEHAEALMNRLREAVGTIA